MNFAEIDSAMLEYREKMLRRDNFINAVCHGVLGMLVSIFIISFIISNVQLMPMRCMRMCR